MMSNVQTDTKCIQQASTKWIVVKTACVIMTSLSLGLSVGLIGPTLVHLRYILGTDTQGMGMSFIGENLGTIAGALLAGLVFDKINQELQFGVACSVLGLCVAYASWSYHLLVYYLVITVQNTAHGFIEASLQSYILNLWAEHKCQPTILHIANTVETAGNVISPFVVIPFLSDLPQNSQQVNNTVHSKASNIPNYSVSLNNAYNQSLRDSYSGVDTIDLAENHSDDIYMVRYAYLTITVPIVLTALLFLFTFFLTKSPLIRKEVKSNKQSEPILEEKKLQTTVVSDTLEETGKLFRFFSKYGMLGLVGLFIAIIMVPEYIFSIYLSTFVIDGLKWPVKDGPLITSVFRGTQGLGQVLGIPLSLVLSPAQMLVGNMMLGTGAFALMAGVPHYQSGADIIMWISVAISGLAVSTMYAGTILWGAQYVKVNAVYGSTMVICTALGGMSEAALTGYLLQHHSHMWLVYLSLAAVVLNIVLFIVILWIAKLFQIEDKVQTTITTDVKKRDEGRQEPQTESLLADLRNNNEKHNSKEALQI